MTEPQIAKLAGALVEHQRYLAPLSSEDAQWAIQNTKEAIELFCDAVKNRVAKVVGKLLEPLGVSFRMFGAKEFIAKKKFVVNTSEDAHVRISYLGDNFKKTMLSKTERDVNETELRLSKLKQASLDAPIITELGDRAEISLVAFYETLAHKQVARDYTWVIGYIRDVSGVLWAVGAYWYGDGWRVSAGSVWGPDRWYAGGGFVSR
ncbi:hypothetical protein HY413_00740 [Candidatus Kaiserbacteria bacterium]|nr:hypothetical protein [Candidatus Kaiserbacteria bacterium]